MSVNLPDDADEEEAAAIAVALQTYLRAQADDAAEEGEEAGWPGRRWAFAGKTRGLRGRSVRIPTGAPRDEWTASGRVDRL